MNFFFSVVFDEAGPKLGFLLIHCFAEVEMKEREAKTETLPRRSRILSKLIFIGWLARALVTLTPTGFIAMLVF